MRKDTPPRIPALDLLREEFVRVARAESRPPTRLRLRLMSLTAAGVVLFAGGVAARIMISSEREAPSEAAGPPARRTQPPSYAGFAQYQSLRAVVARSVFVVAGTVREGAPGEVIPSETGFPTRYRNTVLKVNEIWKGPEADTITVATDELAYGNLPGESDWREPGVRVVAFLSPGDSGEARLFYPTDEQGIYVLSGDALVPTAPGTILSNQIAAMSVQELREAVRSAAQRG